ncbi:MAG: hemin uptake protein HemP [Pikeienuella sp.]
MKVEILKFDDVEDSRASNAPPVYQAQRLMLDGHLAHISLNEQTYTLRITRQGKLLLTK